MPHHACRRFALLLLLVIPQAGRAEMPRSTTVPAGASVKLLKAWPVIAQAPREQLATVECWIRPDAAAVQRPRSFIVVLSNSGGRDSAGISLAMSQGSVRANVLGTPLQSETKLVPDQWTHVALTVNSKTINKQATLWVNGSRAAEELVLEHWPKSFEVAEMFSDKWNQGRVFSGQVGDVRISRVVRYREPFQARTRWRRDSDASLWIAGDQVPLE